MIKAERGSVVWVAMMLVVICTGASGSMPVSGAASAADVAPQSEVLFPVGFMGVQREESFAQVAASRFGVVHEFRGIQEIDEAEDYLERAAAAGLSVIQNMPDCRAYAVPACQAQGITVWGERQWATFISTLAAHPNLIAWFLPDEMRDYAAVANPYAWVHKYDPLDRPV